MKPRKESGEILTYQFSGCQMLLSGRGWGKATQKTYFWKRKVKDHWAWEFIVHSTTSYTTTKRNEHEEKQAKAGPSVFLEIMSHPLDNSHTNYFTLVLALRALPWTHRSHVPSHCCNLQADRSVLQAQKQPKPTEPHQVFRRPKVLLSTYAATYLISKVSWSLVQDTER